MASKKRGEKLAGLYHKGQKHIWDGRDYLVECIDKFELKNKAKVTPKQRAALENIFTIILTGELAAWKISSALAIELEDNEARLAATAQAHDEARHFYVMRDYLKYSNKDYRDQDISIESSDFLSYVMKSNHISKLLLGMQLMVEPLALSLFRVIREKNIDPVLSELLIMFERDEARHVALGTLCLPDILTSMSRVQKAELCLWQFRGYMKQFKALYSLEESFVVLGIDARSVYELARKNQLHAIKLLSKELGYNYPLVQTMMKVADIRYELGTKAEKRSYISRISKAYQRAIA